MSRGKFVVLFDIDGTLVSGPSGRPSAGLQAMNRATESVTGHQNIGDPREFAGRTDPQIAKMLLRLAGVCAPTDSQVRQLLVQYLEALQKKSADEPYLALGDPQGAITSIENLGGTVGLGTGNLKRGAEIKLKSAGILDLFDLEKGGFGDDGHSRADLLRRGIERTASNGSAPIIIVGDTPRDIQAAHQIGALCIAVPFRQNSKEVLLEAGADLVCEQVDAQLGVKIDGLLL